ncbi:hypothetical protein SDC9_199188 [bioreactor metagenome]|uniref:Uncharacterized protein n=1 Tax=bioreactor metagenome TaxID=1076179 RepID=A0A645IK94_9ZZZZ
MNNPTLLGCMLGTMFLSGVVLGYLLLHPKFRCRDGWPHTTKKVAAYIFMISAAYLVVVGLGSWFYSIYHLIMG